MSIARLLVLLVLVASVLLLERVAADKCKKTLRTVFFERCSFRSKRSSPFIQALDQPVHGFSSQMETSQHHAMKRQIMSIREIFVASRVPIYHVPYPSFVRHDSPAVPPSDADIYRVQPPKAESLPQESHSEVGFEMSYEEMIELFNEIYERMPRGTKTEEEMQKELFTIFQECCKNEDLCRTKKDLFKCPY